MEDSASSFGVEPGVGVHGVGHDAPLVGAIVPVPGVSQARVRVALLDLRGRDRSPGVFGDLHAARGAHRLQDLDQQRVVEALHLHEVDDEFDVHEQLSSLQMLVGLVNGFWQERFRCLDWRQLVDCLLYTSPSPRD